MLIITLEAGGSWIPSPAVTALRHGDRVSLPEIVQRLWFFFSEFQLRHLPDDAVQVFISLLMAKTLPHLSKSFVFRDHIMRFLCVCPLTKTVHDNCFCCLLSLSSGIEGKRCFITPCCP